MQRSDDRNIRTVQPRRVCLHPLLAALFVAFLLTVAPSTSMQITAARIATPTPTSANPSFSYPIGDPGHVLGDGFFIRDAYTAENTWYNPGYWHTAEDWYRQDGDTAGAHVYAIAAGEIVFADANYPGRVVIVRHAADLYSMYGHLDPALAVRVGQQVSRGQLLGTVLRRSDGVPSHLHFEVRTFLTTGAVNGAAPRYDFACGVECPPGPGYWPMSDPERPSALGWRNPTHVIGHRAWPAATGQPLADVVVAATPSATTSAVWSAPPGASGARQRGTLPLTAGTTLPLLAVDAGPEASTGTSADAYVLWYQLRLPDGTAGWVQAAVPSTFDTGNDGRPSSVIFNFYPVVSSQ